jgi:hypothetical protein
MSVQMKAKEPSYLLHCGQLTTYPCSVGVPVKGGRMLNLVLSTGACTSGTGRCRTRGLITDSCYSTTAVSQLRATVPLTYLLPHSYIKATSLKVS